VISKTTIETKERQDCECKENERDRGAREKRRRATKIARTKKAKQRLVNGVFFDREGNRTISTSRGNLGTHIAQEEERKMKDDREKKKKKKGRRKGEKPSKVV